MQENGQNSMLHVATSDSAYARQNSTFDRQSTEQQQQQQQELPQTAVKSAGPAVKLELVSRVTSAELNSGSSRPSGRIHVALESWISRAMAKAKTRARS